MDRSPNLYPIQDLNTLEPSQRLGTIIAITLFADLLERMPAT
jgi:hypothetical protein